MEFHNCVAKLLFTTKQERPNIHTEIDFLTTQVRGPYEGDWKKLNRVLTYLESMINPPLTLQEYLLTVAKWWVGASFCSILTCAATPAGVFHCLLFNYFLNPRQVPFFHWLYSKGGENNFYECWYWNCRRISRWTSLRRCCTSGISC